ncbi:FAT4-like protein [Mya arenaria]|uniref:FAT4-like protein n=1 Tax=Mya arenaria TaxID=6604 RepID=A0ABY7DFH3_MYAAR|nr:FAT4-like protein [Mya arenaria]
MNIDLKTEQQISLHAEPVMYAVSPADFGAYFFSVGENSGVLSVRTSLTSDDNLSYTVRIVAMDTGGLSSTATAQITVNRNLNTPTWLQTAYTSTIPENYAQYTEVLQLRASDLDTQAPHRSLVYSISNSNSNAASYFTITSTGVLQLTRTLVGTSGNFQFEVTLSDQGQPQSRTALDRATVTVTVTRNEFSPLFFNSTYYTTILESTSIGNSVMTVSAQDQDTNFNQLTFQVIGDDTASTYFSIAQFGTSQNTATITVRSNLANENRDRYYLWKVLHSFLQVRVLATDNGIPARSATAVVIVDITRNFQAPIWTSNAQFGATIPETQALGVPFLVVSATDGDSQPPHNTVYYTLVSASYNTNTGQVVDVLPYFQLNSATSGEISLRQALVNEVARPARYTLAVRATDGGTPQREASTLATVTVNILRNTNAPQFIVGSYSTSIPKTQPIGQSIFAVTATDADATSGNSLFGVVKYRLVGANTALSYFRIEADTGEISLFQSVETDTTTIYTLLVQAYDNGYPALFDTETVTVTVTRNTLPPTFNQLIYGVTILETQTLGNTIITVSATDPDSLQNTFNNVEYFATGTQEALQYFDLNPSTGAISARQSLQNDMTVYARDYGTPRIQSNDFATVTITVIRNENCPVFQNTPYSTDISQSVATGTSVFSVTATDADGVRIRASDNGNPACSTFEVVYFSLTLNENTPQWLQPSVSTNYQDTTSVLESVGFNTAIYTFQARDNDVAAPYNTLKYTVTGDNTAPLYFFVDETSGEVKLRSALYSDQSQAQYILTVALADQAGRSNVNTATLTINVIRNQNTPYFINLPYRIDISESTALSQSIFTVTALDADQGNSFGQITYRATGDGNAPAFFAVNANTGVISVTQNLAGNTDVVYNLRVTAYDNGVPSLSNSTIVYITVDRNRNAPVFFPASYNAQVADNGILGSDVVQVLVSDADSVPPYNIVKCFLRSSSGSQYFFIDEDSCIIYLARNIALDANAPNTYSLTVGAFDMGIPSRSAIQDATIFISVQRNQFSPVFSNAPYRRTIQQSLGVGSFVERVTATDADTVSPFGDVTLRIIGDDEGTVYFSFSPSSGNITLARDLSLDSASFYQLRIEARDGGNPARSSTSLVAISVNRNLFDPQFTQQSYNITIDETQSLGVNILQISASDLDSRAPHNVITYSMRETNLNSLAAQFFTINSATGAVTLRQSLLNDNADTRRYTFSVSITDNGIPPRSSFNTASVEVNVIRNTVAPFFVGTPYDTTIDYNANIGAQIFVATAQDNDIAPYNTITYDLIGDGDAIVFFRIDSNTGVVSLQQRITQESATQYRLTIRARDSGSPQLFDTETVFVTYNVRARDRGSPQLTSEIVPITIYVLRNKFAPTFINEIYTADITDGYRQGATILTVTATDQDDTVRVLAADGGFPSLMDTTIVYLNITRNRFSPSFTQTQYNTQIAESQSLGTEIIRVSATDRDTALTITVRDLGNPSRAGTNTATVTVGVYRNQFPPVFQTTPYSATINENINNGASIFRFTVTDADTQLRLYAVDGGNVLGPGLASRSAVEILYITVRRNTFPPVFTNANNLQATISEDAFAGSFIVQLTATDDDENAPDNVVRYEIVGDGQAPNYFYINPVDGRISLLASVENTATSFYKIQVRATDGGFPTLSDTTFVDVTVTRVTEVLQFSSQDYQVTITENVAVASSVSRLRVQARKAFSTGVQTAFANVTINVQRNLNAPRFDQLLYEVSISENTALGNSFLVVARDQSSPEKTGTATVRVNILRSQQPPVFTNSPPYSTTINRGEGVGTVVYSRSRAVDSDLQVSHVDSNLQVSHMDSNLQVSNVDSYHKVCHVDSNLQLELLAYDSAMPSQVAYTNITISVTRNPTAPVFTTQDYERTITENFVLGYSLVQIFAEDDDNASDFVRCDIESISAPNVFQPPTNLEDYFYLNPYTCLLTVRQSLTTIGVGAVSMTVRATDDGIPPRSSAVNAQVRINIIRNENDPAFINTPYIRTISETTSVGTSILTVTATDQDNVVNNNLVHCTCVYRSLLEEKRDYYIGRIMAYDMGSPPRSAVVTVRINIDRNIHPPVFNPLVYNATIMETDPTNTLVMTITGSDADRLLLAKDNEDRISTQNAQVTINVIRNLFPPVFRNMPYSTTIPCTAGAGYRVLQVDSTDADTVKPYNSVRYSIIGDNMAPERFYINPATGVIYTSTKNILPDRDTFVVRVLAEDGGTPMRSSTATVVISVDCNLHTPVWLQTNYTVTVNEVQDLGVDILTVRAVDQDLRAPQKTVRYRLVDDNECFLLNPVTGDLALRGSLNYEPCAAGVFNMRAEICDMGTPQLCGAYVDIRVNVLNNDNAPIFISDPYSKTLSDSASVGSLPPCNTLSYSFCDDTSRNYFAINSTTGCVTLANTLPLDCRYQICLQVNDGGLPSKYDTTTLTVNINCNKFSPVFDRTLYDCDQTTIYEDQVLGEEIVCVTATDADDRTPYNDIRYTTSGIDSTNALTYFAVSPNDGCVYLRRSLTTDNFQQSNFTLYISAYDLGTPQRTSDQQVRVNLCVIRNRFCPRFNNLPEEITISQSQSTFARVFNISATDGDANVLDGRFSQVKYTLIGDDNAPVLFNIDPDRGFVTVTSNGLLSDSASVYQLRVRAADGSSILCYSDSVLTINVLRNENCPVFAPSRLYQATITESQGTSGPVITVTANDRDIHVRISILTYRIYIKKVTNVRISILRYRLYMKKVTDVRISILCYRLYMKKVTNVTIIAQDGGFPSCQDNATVIVNILRNQFPPVFDNELYSKTIVCNEAVNTNLLTVSATDADTRVSQDGILFDLTELLLCFRFTEAHTSLYNIRVRVRDGGSPARSDTTVVVVYVTRNLSPPVFSPLQYTQTIADTCDIGGPILFLTATDSDFCVSFVISDHSRFDYPTPFNVVRYRMIGDDVTPTYFGINEASGVISLRNVSLLQDAATTYTARIEAYDGACRTRTATSTVRITVPRNLCDPIFDRTDTYSVNILETAPVGSLRNVNVNVVRVSTETLQFTLQTCYSVTIPETERVDQSIIQTLANPGIQARAVIGGVEQTAAACVNITVTRNSNCPVFIGAPYSTAISENLVVGRSVASVTVVVNQVCTGSPQFSQGPYSGTVRENEANGTVVTSASCFDNALTGSIVYEPYGYSLAAAYFEIDRQTGSVFVSNSNALRLHRGYSYSFPIQCYDSACPDRKVYSDVSITVECSTNVPVFQTSRYFKTIFETWELGTEILAITASDNDGDVITYSITGDAFGTSSRIEEFYYIVSTTGDIYLKKPLTEGTQLTDNVRIFVTPCLIYCKFNVNCFIKTTIYHSKTNCLAVFIIYIFSQIGLRACDSRCGTPQCGTAVFTLTIQRDRFSPFLQPCSATIGTECEINSLGQIRYVADGENPYFNLNSTTGQIRLQSCLTSDTAAVYYMRLRVFDTEYPARQGTGTCTIFVNRNPNPPIITSPTCAASISENANLGLRVFNITASDADGVRILIISIMNMAKLITLINYNQYELTHLKFQFTVTVSDQSNPEKTTSTNCFFTILRDTCPPEFIRQPFQVTVDECLPETASVYTVTATDCDLQGSLVYNVYPNFATDDLRAQYYFSINNNGEIRVRNNLRTESTVSTTYEVGPKHSLVFPDATGTATVTITVGRNPSAPAFDSNSYQANVDGCLCSDTKAVSILNISATDTCNVRVEAYDIDCRTQVAEAQVNIQVICNENGPEFPQSTYRVTINETATIGNCFLTLAASDQDQVRVVASDNSECNPKTTVTDVIITVTRDQFPPFFLNTPYSTTILQCNNIGGFVFNVNATDRDLAGRIQYSLIGDYPAPSFFSVDPFSGIVTTTTTLLRDINFASVYTARVTAIDNVRPNLVATATVAISVICNPSAPVFTQCVGATIPESTAVGSVLFNVSANDFDSNVSIFIYIKYIFFLKLRKCHCERNKIKLITTTCDSGVPQRCSNTTCGVSVVTCPTTPPTFISEPYDRTIPESTVVGSAILSVTATDQSVLGSRVYEAMTTTYPFALDRNTGIITLQFDNLYYGPEVYSFRVRAYDTACTLYDESLVTIRITKNPSGPVFTRDYSTNVQCNLSPGSLILNTTAVDSDGDVVRYYLTDIVGSEYFYITADFGQIYLRRSLTGSNNQFSFRISASDQRNPERVGTTNVFINVRCDSGPPFFVNEPYTFTICDNPVDTVVYERVRAQDNDIQLSLLVYDTAYPDARDTTDVIINVICGDTCPQFRPSSTYRTSVSENRAVGTEILNVNAFDAENNVVRYDLVNGTNSALTYFYLDPATGAVLVRDDLVRDPFISRYLLTVRAVSRECVVYATVEILVNREVFECPFFTNTPYRRTIFSSQALNQTLVTVSAGARNLVVIFSFFLHFLHLIISHAITIFIKPCIPPLQGQIRFRTLGYFPATDYFRIDEVSGAVTMYRTIQDRLTCTQVYVLTVEAYDNAFPINAERCTEDIYIEVNCNPNPPVVNSFYSESVCETIGLGANIVCVSATDQDGDLISYEMIDDQNNFQTQFASDFFYLTSNGCVYVQQVLTESLRDTYTFTVRARDDGYPQRFVETTVQIVILRDATAPVFDYQDGNCITVSQRAIVNGSLPILSVRATDSDLQYIIISQHTVNIIRNILLVGEIVYEAYGDSLAQYYFMINQLGQIFVRNSLTAARYGTYNLRLRAYDNYYPCDPSYPRNYGYTTVCIQVECQTSVSLGQTSFQFNINENYPLGNTIVNFGDIGGLPLHYQLVPTNGNDSDYFYVNYYTGEFSLRRIPNPNANSYRIPSLCLFQMTVEGTYNQGICSLTTTATINVIVTRNQSPQCTQQNRIAISDSTSIGTRVYTMSASDQDMVGTMMYRVIGDTYGPGFFTVDPSTGVVTSNANLREDYHTTYTVRNKIIHLRVLAYDSALPDDTCEMTLVVTVTRNPNTPVCRGTPYSVTLPENTAVGTVVLNVTATDADGLTVRASDQAIQAKFSDCRVTINIVRDENPPVFMNQPYKVKICDDQPLNQTFFSVSALDRDLSKMEKEEKLCIDSADFAYPIGYCYQNLIEFLC